MADHLIAPAHLEAFAVSLLTALGTPPEIAVTVGRHLVGANLAGHDSHGVLRLPQYAAEVDRGELHPAATPLLTNERGAVAVIDGRAGFGHSATAFAMEWAAQKAAETGIAGAAIRHANHIGRLGEYAEIAARRGVIGITTVGVVGAGGVSPFGARGRFLGTNPWSIGIPSDGEPMIFDAATSAVAEGKLRLARAKGVPVAAGAIVSSEGEATTDPNDYYAGGAMLPMGGALAGHKGFGLSLAAALIGGLAMIDDPQATMGGTSGRANAHSAAWLGGAFVVALDPAWFGPASSYLSAVGGALSDVRRQAPAAGVDRVLVPGDPERRSRESRAAHGIPIPQATWTELSELAARYGVGAPG
ncbi:MAG: Ldh family oxidoreductase [Candidatus Dormibacteraeota bacterium]|nr:Ldh family oxidoreductase [Candidatus Dormibacteraeota bacterium]